MPKTSACRRSGGRTRPLILERLESRKLLATYLVTTTAPDGPNSLAQAIVDANANAGADRIEFNIPETYRDPVSRVFTIKPTSAFGSENLTFPKIEGPLTIDGYSQPGAHANTKPIGNDAHLLIELSGEVLNYYRTIGLRIDSNDVTVRGLVINRFGTQIDSTPRSNIVVEGNFLGTNAAGSAAGGGPAHTGIYFAGVIDGHIGGPLPPQRNVISGLSMNGIYADLGARLTIQGNYIGTDAEGAAALGGDVGVNLSNSLGDNLIGGAAPGAGNVISGNRRGVFMQYRFGATIEGNLIGTDATGMSAVPNREGGISLRETSDVIIGGTTAEARNVISGNAYSSGSYGIQLSITERIAIQGNYIGTNQNGDVTGENPLGNFEGIAIVDGLVTNSTIGGVEPGAGNIIAYSAFRGIGSHGSGIRILSNSIHSSGSLGIDLAEPGVNPRVTPNDAGDTDERQNFPVIIAADTSGTNLAVSGSLHSSPDRDYRLEFFASAAADESGHGEGQRYLGFLNIHAGGAGDAPFSVSLSGAVAAGEFISATATLLTLEGDELVPVQTSEFSAAVAVTAAPVNHAPEILALDLSEHLIEEHDTVILTGSLTDLDPQDAHSVLIDWGPGEGTTTLSLEAGALTFTAHHQYLDDNPSGTSADAYTVTATVTDARGASDAAETTLTVVNTIGDVIWSRQFGGAGFEHTTAVASDGNVYVVGDTETALPGQTSAGNYDAFLRKYDSNGQEVWTRQFGSAAADFARAVAVDDSGIYVVGDSGATLPGQTSPNGAFVRKYDFAGNELWTHQFRSVGFGVGGTSATGIALAASGVYVSGSTGGTLPGQTSLGGFDAFLRKYDAAGNEIWTRQFGTSFTDQSTGVAMADDEIYVVGSKFTQFSHDSFVRKFDVNGNMAWNATSGLDSPNGVAADASGVYVVGYIDDFAEVRKYSAGGESLWTKFFVGSLRAVAVAPSGVYVSGAFPGQIGAGNEDMFVRQYDAEGVEGWTRRFGTLGFRFEPDLAVDAAGIYLSGVTAAVLPGHENAGEYDALLAKLSLEPDLKLSLTPDAIHEGDSTILTGEFSDPGTLDTHTVVIDWADGSPPTILDLTAGVTSFTASHRYLEYLDERFLYPISVTVTDDDNSTVSGQASISVRPAPPSNLTLDALPNVITEGEVVLLTGAFSDFGRPNRLRVIIDWGDTTLTNLSQDAGDTNFGLPYRFRDDSAAIAVTVTDFFGGSVSASVPVTVSNVPPSITALTGMPAAINEGEFITLTGAFTDPGKLDSHTVLIDWGDGTTSTGMVNQTDGGGTASGTHAYAQGGVYTVTVRVSDDDGGTSSASTTAIVTGVGLHDGVLQIIGSAVADRITVKRHGQSRLAVSAAAGLGFKTRLFELKQIERLMILVGDGNDSVSVAATVVVPVILDGGGGNDLLKAGGGPAVLLGGEGVDDLQGGRGRGILIGGRGRDRLRAGAAGDILIGGSTALDPPLNPQAVWEQALLRVVDQWSARTSYSNRVKETVKHLSREHTVFDDGDSDVLIGGAKDDLFFAGLNDHLVGRKKKERIL